VFYVIAGTMSFLVDGTWVDAAPGAFVLVPGGTTHDFENRGEVRAGLLNFSVPGEFEPHMPGIVEWFEKNPPGDAGG
jgi:mannose-6-phosphate isomerase-like protein (cupin superfamily)